MKGGKEEVPTVSTSSPPAATSVDWEEANAKMRRELVELVRQKKRKEQLFLERRKKMAEAEAAAVRRRLEEDRGELGRRRRPAQCSQCPCSYQDEICLSLHVQLVHVGITPRKCDFCWRSFPSELTRRNHVRRMHSGEWRRWRRNKRKTRSSGENGGCTSLEGVGGDAGGRDVVGQAAAEVDGRGLAGGDGGGDMDAQVETEVPPVEEEAIPGVDDDDRSTIMSDCEEDGTEALTVNNQRSQTTSPINS